MAKSIKYTGKNAYDEILKRTKIWSLYGLKCICHFDKLILIKISINF